MKRVFVGMCRSGPWQRLLGPVSIQCVDVYWYVCLAGNCPNYVLVFMLKEKPAKYCRFNEVYFASLKTQTKSTVV